MQHTHTHTRCNTHTYTHTHTHTHHSREEFAIDFPGGEARDLFLLARVAFAVGPLLVALHVGQVLLRGLLDQRVGGVTTY
jgi:hypothetical protein